jgi:hypothetical protein
MDEQIAETGAAFKIGDLLDLATRHFALFSASVIMLGGFTATIFLAAYLRAFDWRLLWIVEPSDILKVGIFSIAFLSGFFYLIQNTMNWAADWEEYGPFNRRVAYATVFVIFSLVILNDERSAESHFFLHFSIFGLLALLFLAMVFIPKIRSRITLSYNTIYSALSIYIGIIVFLGLVVGTYVKEIGGFTEDVLTKDEQFQNVVVIIATSHHTALLTKDDSVIVIPSTDIKKIQTTKGP